MVIKEAALCCLSELLRRHKTPCNDELPIVSVFEEDALAPFLGCGQETENKLFRLGVMDKKKGLYEDSLALLAAVFAENLSEYFERRFEES